MNSAILTKSTDVVSKTNTYCRSVHFPLSQPFSSLCWQSAIQRCCGMRSSSSKKRKKKKFFFRTNLIEQPHEVFEGMYLQRVCVFKPTYVFARGLLYLDHSDLFTLFPRVIHLLLEISSCLISTFPVHSTSFFLIFSRLFPCVADAGCRVGPRNKMGHSAHQQKRFTRFPCCLLYTSPSPRDMTISRMPSSA